MVSARLVLICALLAAPAFAQAPRVHHAPVSEATAGEPLAIRADVEHPELVRQAVLIYSLAAEPALREVPFQRASSGPYVAIVPEEHVRAPGLGYTIELEHVDGRRSAVFASRGELHGVQIAEDLDDIRERALYERLGGRRSVVAASVEYVWFGDSDTVDPASGQPTEVSDRYYRIEGSYTYRPLRIVSEFGVRGGTLRGRSPVPVVRELAPGQDESERYEVGIDYGAPRVRFRLSDFLHLDGELVVGFTELGFSWGGGGAVLIGDPYGSKLVLGFESLQDFGTRIYSRMDVFATDHARFSPIVEVTNMPSADDYGVRLLGEIGFDFGSGFAAAVRGGYQARVFTSGGPSAGATVAYAF